MEESKMRAILLFFALLIVSTAVFAEDEGINYKIHQPFVTTRALGMGNTFSGVDDYSVLFYNPAGLARLKEGELNMMIRAGAAPAILDLQKDLEDAGDDSQAMTDVLTDQFGNVYSMRMPMLSGIWARPGWGIGIIPVDSSVDVQPHASVGPTLKVSAYIDTTIAFGYAMGFLEEDALTAGALVKAVHRGYVGQEIVAVDLLSNTEFFRDDMAQEGMTLDLDIGAQYKMPIPEKGFLSFLKFAKPTFGMVVRNLLDFGFKQNFHFINENSTEPPKLGRRIDVGSMWEFPSFWVFHPRFMFDVRDIGHRHWAFTKGLHIGAELLWKAFWWLEGGYRVGFSQGYLTAGLTAQFVWFKLDLATYAEEVGTTEAGNENRLYMVSMSLDF
jgi:hypothetical protein